MGSYTKGEDFPILKPPATPVTSPIPEPTPIKPKMPSKGVDISHYQGAVDFKLLKAQGFDFVYVKASEGVTYKDDQFDRSWAEAPKAGMLVGAYHFFRPKDDPIEQAVHFARIVGPQRPSDLPICLDWEPTNDGVRNSIQIDKVSSFLNYLSAKYSYLPMIYGSPSFLESFGDLSKFSKYPLWIAHYGVPRPRVPKAWRDYTFWQVSDYGGMDKNQFNGDFESLNAYLLSNFKA